MSTEEIIFDVEERMEKAAGVFKHALTGVRTGRANPGLVDSLRVEVYGAPVVLKSVAQVGAPEPTQIVIRPFDPGTIKDIEKSIRASDLGFNPSNDGRVIRIAIPPLSTDVRRKLVSRIKEMGEEARVSIRNVRRDGNKAADDAEKEKTLTEDECKQAKDQIQELTKQYENKVNDLAKAKETEVMEQ
ncbi:MAG TPA: ribosome recycling factor [Pirellulales bacterium]|jgi:ribosome recycling factor|nr:ribosome recycling factor [Pirellulales bacterium]